MSTDWEKYATPNQARARARKTPELNGIVALIAGEVRSIQGLSVEHAPILTNRAHTEVFGLAEDEVEKTERRVHLFDLCHTWLLEPSVWP
jgi:hypothetical protein